MANLQFQSFDLGGADSPFTNSNQEYRTNTRDQSNLLADGDASTDTTTKHHFLTFKFYQQYFDVDTDQVYSRILNSVVPKMGGNFIRDHVQPTPDLYGPFWICVTLVFFAAICGNFAHYIDSLGENPYSNDFGLVTGAATLISCYVIIVPFVVYMVLWHRNAAIQYSYIELVCAFGYSLAIFIPVSVLWVFHYQWFRWALIIGSVVLSGSVLANTIWSAIKNDSNRVVILALIGGVLVMHGLVAVGIKEFYFDTVIPSAARGTVSNAAGTPLILSPQALINTTVSEKRPLSEGLVGEAPVTKSQVDTRVKESKDSKITKKSPILEVVDTQEENVLNSTLSIEKPKLEPANSINKISKKS